MTDLFLLNALQRTITKILIITASLSMMACLGPSSVTDVSGVDHYTKQEIPPFPGIDDLMENMTLREKIAQMFVVAARGGFYTEENRSWNNMVEAVAMHKVGGVMFFSGDIYDQAAVTNRLQQLAEIPLWVSQDMEFGAAMRIRQATYLTPAMGIAATGNPLFAYHKGRITGLEAKAMGIHQVYAPVLDINNNPLNPVINIRSFSENADTVALYGLAFADGVRDAGLLSTAKHFPGHGDTEVDSHADLPVLLFEYDRLKKMELVPFQAAVDAGIPSIMTGHIALPLVAENEFYPATLDPFLIHSLLRDTLSFDGLIVTDGMGMRGIRNYFPAGEAAVLAVKAGVDQILLPANLTEALDAVELAVLAGKITEERIDQSVRRILSLKEEHGLFDAPPMVDMELLPYKIGTREYRLLADRIAQESITVLKNEELLPLVPANHEQVLVLNVSDGRRPVNDYLSRELGTQFENLTTKSYYPGLCLTDSLDIIRAFKESDLVILVTHMGIRTADIISLEMKSIPLFNELSSGDRNLIALSLGSPYVLNHLSHANVHMLAWSTNPRQQRAAALALLGAAPVNGKLPVSIPPQYSAGQGIRIPVIHHFDADINVR